MSKRVLFYVQHLLGVGHLKRASLIARAMSESGLSVTVALGGPEVPGVEFNGCARVLLPSARASDGTFTKLVDENDNPIDDDWREGRAARLMTAFETIQPDVLLVEQFPFGRRQFRFELMPLLAAARTASQAPRTVSSVRDVLVRKDDPKRNDEMVAVARTWFDRILVHGDRSVLRLEASMPETAALAATLTYTGYVVDPADPDNGTRDRTSGRDEVVVSVGGGAVGEPLLRAAIAARPLSRLSQNVWRLICGTNLADSVLQELAWDPPPGIVVDRWRSDFPVLLRNCVLSISQGGYNTVMDILQARARAVIVPFAAGTETEQEFRARALEQRGLVTVVNPKSLSPNVLANAIDKALETKVSAADIDCSGAKSTAKIVAALCTATES